MLSRIGLVAIVLGLFSLGDYAFYKVLSQPMNFCSVAIATLSVFTLMFIKGDCDDPTA